MTITPTCPKCNGKDVSVVPYFDVFNYYCQKCGKYKSYIKIGGKSIEYIFDSGEQIIKEK
jgi:hypothetical protein